MEIFGAALFQITGRSLATGYLFAGASDRSETEA
jgi:hypothetical protein